MLTGKLIINVYIVVCICTHAHIKTGEQLCERVAFKMSAKSVSVSF